MEEKKICKRCKKELPLIDYYKCHNDEYYDTCKTCMKWYIDDNNEDTYLSFLKDMNYPYIKEEWNYLNERNNEKGRYRFDTIFGKYISKMRLKGFKSWTWEDSEELNNLREEKAQERKIFMNPFAQRIGIYYVDLDWATYMLKTIVEESGDVVERSAYNKNNTFIEFKDGSYIKFLPMSESVRGQRFTKAYIQDECLGLEKSKDFIFQVVYPCLTLGQKPECYFIHEYEDLRKQCTEVRDYYWQLEFGDDWCFEKAKAMLDSAYKYKEVYHDNN